MLVYLNCHMYMYVTGFAKPVTNCIRIEIQLKGSVLRISTQSYFHRLTLHHNGRRPYATLYWTYIVFGNRCTINLGSVLKYFCFNKYVTKGACQNNC